MWPNGLDVLGDLGVRERVCRLGNTSADYRLRTASGRVDTTIEFPNVGPEPGFVVVHRADLHEALLETVPEQRVQFGTTVEAIRERADTVDVELSTGETRDYDLVVGADGVGSAVRRLCFDSEFLDPVDTGVWSFWTEATAPFPEEITSLSGPATEAILVEIDGRGLVNVATKLESEDEPAPTADRLRTVLEELGWVLPATLDRRTGPLFADHVREVTMDRWIRDRIALIGDAAHAVHPISGMGAALAFEDARTLADRVDRSSTVPGALEGYFRDREADVRSVQRDTAVMEPFLLADSRALRLLRDGVLSATPLVEWALRRRIRALTPNEA
ncbi:FAD-dependent oxidoreductase [Natronococcus pandeyae]|uniref:FAD-dependent oxidoreductase n=1 Tax=Natronococcus pandeyae TaxID=2055836 RepID=UPI002277C7FB|nr:NAD(P)/FAD-dependent oxidoreductase [Natronococcus pandeyae]